MIILLMKLNLHWEERRFEYVLIVGQRSEGKLTHGVRKFKTKKEFGKLTGYPDIAKNPTDLHWEWNKHCWAPGRSPFYDEMWITLVCYSLLIKKLGSNGVLLHYGAMYRKLEQQSKEWFKIIIILIFYFFTWHFALYSFSRSLYKPCGFGKSWLKVF